MNITPPKTPGKVNFRGYTPNGARHDLSFDERTPLVNVLQTLLDHLCTLCVSDNNRAYTYDGRLWRSAGTVTAECRARVGGVKS